MLKFFVEFSKTKEIIYTHACIVHFKVFYSFRSGCDKAIETWRWYKTKEDSRIFDLFVGLLESALKCSECGYTSLTYDPFWDLSLPLAKVYLL